MILGTTSNYSALQLLDIDKVFNAKLKIPLLNHSEASKVIGTDLAIQNVPIKKLVNFKEICRDKPQSVWKSLWSKYSS